MSRTTPTRPRVFARLYINGALATAPVAASSTFTGYTVGNVFAAGRTQQYVPRTQSRRDEFAVYTTALSAARIQAHYNAGAASQPGQSIIRHGGRGAGW